MSAPIFISFSSKDHKVAETICDALENRGFSCWISNRDVLPGQNYQEAISRAIRTAKLMLLVFTANANNSDEIKKELALASRAKVIVIPLRVEDVVPNDAFDYEFATRQWIDLFDGWEAAFKTLTAQIATIVPPQFPISSPAAARQPDAVAASTAAVARPATDWASLLKHRGAIVAACAVALVLLAALLTWHYTGVRTVLASAPPLASADPFPHRRPGLWEQRTTSTGANQFLSKLCIDRATEAALIGTATGTAKKNCSVIQNQTVGTATISDTICKVGKWEVTGHTVGTFISDTAFHLNASTHATGDGAPPDTSTAVDGSWLGPCPATMKPGDLLMPDGRTVNLLKP